MEKLVIHGGRRLEGRVKISGAKNAVLPIIAATLLGQDSPSILDEVPALEDVHTITEVLQELGVKAEFRKETHQLFVDSTVIGSPISLLKFFCVLHTLNFCDRTEAINSLVLVLPTLPVIPTTGMESCSR